MRVIWVSVDRGGIRRWTKMLEYETQRVRYQVTPEDRVWLGWRLMYYAAHVVLFLTIIYRAGPNLFLFHSMSSPTPGDYAKFTRTYVPLIAAIKAYQRDYGALPADDYELP